MPRRRLRPAFVPAALIAALAAAAFAPAASAQYVSSYGYTFNNPVSAFCNDLMWNDINARQTYKALLKKRGFTDAQIAKMSTKQMVEVLGADTKFSEASPSSGGTPPASVFKPAGRRLFFPTLAQSLASRAEDRKVLMEAFEAGLKGYEEGAAESGFVNDLAGAMAFFIGVGYAVLHDGADPDEKGLDQIGFALRRSMDTPRVRGISDAEKQRFYELMIGLGTYLGAAYGQAVRDGDKAGAATIQTAAGETLKAFLNIDPAAMRITADGLELVRGR